mmetsp:Transcript_30896/g.64032  ORF Transcript_30896/g.64032 Transcript_30896/m.64032 type:complete len:292 (+) Transcript_30896:1241-2116(+)
MDREKERKEAEKEQRTQRQSKFIAMGKKAAANTNSVLHNQDMWPCGDVLPRIAHLSSLTQKMELLHAQYVHVQAWYKEAKIEFPYAKQPPSKAYAVWLALIIELQGQVTYPRVLAYRATHVPKEDVGILKSVEQTPADLCCEIMSEEELAEWNAAIINDANTSVHRSKKQRAEAQEDAAQARAERERFSGFVHDDDGGGNGAGGGDAGVDAGVYSAENGENNQQQVGGGDGEEEGEEEEEESDSDNDLEVSQGEMYDSDVEMEFEDGNGVELNEMSEGEEMDMEWQMEHGE